MSYLNSLTTVRGFSNNHNVGVLRQHLADSDSRDFVIVCYQNGDWVAHLQNNRVLL
jgi:hypothetical protein